MYWNKNIKLKSKKDDKIMKSPRQQEWEKIHDVYFFLTINNTQGNCFETNIIFTATLFHSVTFQLRTSKRKNIDDWKKINQFLIISFSSKINIVRSMLKCKEDDFEVMTTPPEEAEMRENPNEMKRLLTHMSTTNTPFVVHDRTGLRLSFAGLLPITTGDNGEQRIWSSSIILNSAELGELTSNELVLGTLDYYKFWCNSL